MEKTEISKNNNIKLISMHDEMSSSYLSYAMSVIVSRALPDIRDGLKPVHRRILYAMYKGGYDWTKQFRKSARIVGDVIGKYHPHGDQSVYDALVRMVQDFSMSLPLVDGQGNFGSIDGDPPAAMRYTETRLSKVSQFLIDDIEKKNAKRQKDWQKEAANAKARAKDYRDKQKIYKDFFGKLGKRDLKNRDYEEFFRQMGTKELQDLGLDPDAIRIKLDQIMEWNDPNINPTSNK